MIAYPGPKFPYTPHPGNTLSGRPRSKSVPANMAANRSPGAGLLLALLLSLGLWAALWKAVSSMAAAWLG